MKMNYDYCKLDENAMLRYAPSIIKDDAGYHANPPQELYASNGWYRKTATPPEAAEGRYWVENEPRDWAWDAETMTVTVTYREVIVPEPEPMPRRWTPLTLKRGAEAKGWWAAFKGILEAAGGYEDFLMCKFVSEDDAMFSPIYGALCDAFGREYVDAYLNELPTEA